MVTDYFPEGIPCKIWKSDNGRVTDQKHFDRNGNEVSAPIAFQRTITSEQ